MTEAVEQIDDIDVLISSLQRCRSCDLFIYPDDETQLRVERWRVDRGVTSRGGWTNSRTAYDGSGTEHQIHDRIACYWRCGCCSRDYAQLNSYSRHWEGLATRTTTVPWGQTCDDCYSRWESDVEADGSGVEPCYHCERMADRDNMEWSDVYSDQRVCSNCFQDERECDDCGNIYNTDNGHDCDSHRDFDASDYRGIHSYSYKPDPIFFGDGNYHFGIELEVESMDNNIPEAVDECYNFSETDNGRGRLYLKSDGSIDRGFEIVTHPHTLQEFQENFPWELLMKLRRRGFRSWNTKTCGLHVHVSRMAFVPNEVDRGLSRAEKRDTHQIKFLKLIYDNKDYVQRLAGRKSSWATFNDKGNVIRKVKQHYQSDARYSAVNIQPTQTYEVRVFKGSLRKERVLSAIEFVHAAVEYTRDLPVVPKNDPFAWNNFYSYILQHKATYPNLCLILDELFIKTTASINRQEETV